MQSKILRHIFEPLCHLRQGRPIVRDNDVRPLGGKMLDRAPHEGQFAFKPCECFGGGVALDRRA